MALANTPPRPERVQLSSIDQDLDGHHGLISPTGKLLHCAEPLTEPSPSASRPKLLSVSLTVKWKTVNGKCRQNNLVLQRIGNPIHDLTGMAKDLVGRAFQPNSMPIHLTSASHLYYHFSPVQECLSLPSDVASTVLKLVVQYDGWEYVVYERALRTEASASEDEDTPLLVTVIEFESTAMVIGALGIRVQLVAYPVVSIRKEFLDDVDFRLRCDPDGFKGILS